METTLEKQLHIDVVKLYNAMNDEQKTRADMLIHYAQKTNKTPYEIDYLILRSAFGTFDLNSLSTQSQAEFLIERRKIEQVAILTEADECLLEIIGMLTPEHFAHQYKAFNDAIKLTPERPEISYLVRAIMRELNMYKEVK